MKATVCAVTAFVPSTWITKVAPANGAGGVVVVVYLNWTVIDCPAAKVGVPRKLAVGGEPEKELSPKRGVTVIDGDGDMPTAGSIIFKVLSLTGTFPSFLIVKVTKTTVPAPGAIAPPWIFKLTFVEPPAR